MRGGYVRGGASPPHSPRRMERGGEEENPPGGRKIRRTTEGEAFTGSVGLVPRVEEWMVEDTPHGEMVPPAARVEAVGMKMAKKKSFAETVRTRNSNEQPGAEGGGTKALGGEKSAEAA
ncbi:hypothetical protein PIB30_048521 [Stylosanthes scabra]|uniref:Uncharacterized protein n=1 Tax=Stylosanthes scabra TaxID=79078 RepID=A0ABU6YHJ2_9FABA|nr:hypothetical protein [Stylosanthes scabra]